jgi:hypothetical protein
MVIDLSIEGGTTGHHLAHPLDMCYCFARRKESTGSILLIYLWVHHTKNCNNSLSLSVGMISHSYKTKNLR